METQARNQQQVRKAATNSNKSKQRSSSSNSDTELAHSPLRYHSPRSDAGDPPETPPYASPEASPGNHPSIVDNSKAIVAVDGPEKVPSPVFVFNRAVREEPTAGVTKVGPTGGGEEGGRASAVKGILMRSMREELVKTAALGFRVSEIVLCLISFSVMAADKTQGWSGDSFDRYKEYRYCLTLNVIAFVYAGFQAYCLASHIISGKHPITHPLRYHFDFVMDQIIAYLLISASSSAATRVDDWQSNWGKDEFTEMASASVAMSFLAFIAFAISALISGYNLCNREAP